MQNDLIRPSLAEFIGTFVLVFLGGAAVASGQGVAVAALAHGLTVAGMVYAFGHISGTHINPAVTAGLLAGGKITVARAIAYWIAQFLGGIVAALVLSAVLATSNVGPTIGALTETNVWGAAILEFFMVFILVTTVYQAAVFGKAGNLAGVAIGFTLTAIIMGLGTYTGASVNPARTLGPALVDGNLSYVLPYFVGMFLGGAASGLVHTYLFRPDDK